MHAFEYFFRKSFFNFLSDLSITISLRPMSKDHGLILKAIGIFSNLIEMNVSCFSGSFYRYRRACERAFQEKNFGLSDARLPVENFNH